MANILKNVALTAIALSASTWGAPGHAETPWNNVFLLSQAATAVHLNENCQRVAEAWNTWRVDERHPFQAGGQTYWLVIAKYQDGASRLCMTRPGFIQGKPLSVPQLQSQYFNRIFQEGTSSSFLIDHRDGNERTVLITRYRLNLANPSNPKLTRLKQWIQ